MIRDEDVEKKISGKWDVPVINDLSGRSHLVDNYNALTVIDKKLRPSGTQAKAQSAFSIYQVHVNNLYLVCYM